MKLLNIIMELKKCCNHPFLFPQAEEEYRGREGDVGTVDRLVRYPPSLLKLLLTSMSKLKAVALVSAEAVCDMLLHCRGPWYGWTQSLRSLLPLVCWVLHVPWNLSSEALRFCLARCT